MKIKSNKGFKPHYRIINFYGDKILYFYLINPIKRKVKHFKLNNLLLLCIHGILPIKVNASKYINSSTYCKHIK